ncbi:MAG: hypothetical protein CVV50_03565 [Spirochaetae bacterium HGW-Spirochaetae-6]|nr:MAG: hypothetical protein CVV50_03565 [Spirochaetae bacterium HGW-Spirochaetae-6]
MKKSNISDLMLEQALLGELPPMEYERVMSAIKEDPILRERFEDLKRSNEEFHAYYPTYQFMADLHSKVDLNRPKSKRFLLSFKTVFSASFILLLSMGLFFIGPWGGESDTMREKGLEPFLSIYRQRDQKEVETLREGMQVKEGDLLQIGLVARGQAYGAVFSVDGRGVVTWHYPKESSGGTRLPDQSKEWVLPYAYELDDAPAYEQFYFISSHWKIDALMLRALTEKLAAALLENPEVRLILPPQFKLFTLKLHKEEQ